MVLMVKKLPASAGDIRDMGLIPGLGRSPGGGNGNPLQYPCLENPMDRVASGPMVHRFTKSQAGLKQLTTHYHLENVPKCQRWLCYGMSQTTSRKKSGYGAAQCFRLPPWYMHNALSPPHLPSARPATLRTPRVQPSLGVHLACLVGTDRGHRWGGVLRVRCHLSCELSLRPCPTCSVQGLFCQGPADYPCGHYLYSPPLCPGLWCPLEEPHTHLPEALLA